MVARTPRAPVTAAIASEPSGLSVHQSADGSSAPARGRDSRVSDTPSSVPGPRSGVRSGPIGIPEPSASAVPTRDTAVADRTRVQGSPFRRPDPTSPSDPEVSAEETIHIEEPTPVPNTPNGEDRNDAVGLEMSDDLARELGSAFEAMFASEIPGEDGIKIEAVPGFGENEASDTRTGLDAGQTPGPDAGQTPGLDAGGERADPAEPPPPGLESRLESGSGLGYAVGPDSAVGLGFDGRAGDEPDAGTQAGLASGAGLRSSTDVEASAAAGAKDHESGRGIGRPDHVRGGRHPPCRPGGRCVPGDRSDVGNRAGLARGIGPSVGPGTSRPSGPPNPARA